MRGLAHQVTGEDYDVLRGQMMNRPLMIADILRHAAFNHGQREIVSRLPDTGEIHRYGYADCYKRTQQLANVLTGPLKVKPGDRITTIAWNTHRHMELYYAVSGIGAVVHTANPRLSPEQLAWIIDHAKAKHVFFDVTFAPLVDAVAKHCKTVKRWVAMTGEATKPETKTKIDVYETLLSNADDHYDFPELTRTPRRACATPPAPRAIPRVRSIRTAQRFCTPWRAAASTPSAWARTAW